MNYQVYSGNPDALEAGYGAQLEGVFKTMKDANEYVKTWNDLYPNEDVIFWCQSRN